MDVARAHRESAKNGFRSHRRFYGSGKIAAERCASGLLPWPVSFANRRAIKSYRSFRNCNPTKADPHSTPGNLRATWSNASTPQSKRTRNRSVETTGSPVPWRYPRFGTDSLHPKSGRCLCRCPSEVSTVGTCHQGCLPTHAVSN